MAALPPMAATWRPHAVGGEAEWNIGQIVAHIGGSRLYFASAYRGEGWIWEKAERDMADQQRWLPWLETSAERFAAPLRETPQAWLTRRVEMIDTTGAPRPLIAFASVTAPEESLWSCTLTIPWTPALFAASG